MTVEVSEVVNGRRLTGYHDGGEPLELHIVRHPMPDGSFAIERVWRPTEKQAEPPIAAPDAEPGNADAPTAS